ncbi:MAG: peptidylprolyl isomerase, partial [Bradyrhizobium sp.]|nr:peptidylprolyl isomerase [Bradyrhizobium sp.]
GRLGQVVLGETTPEFETFLIAMQPGQICPTSVRTAYGVHVLRLDRKIAGVALPFEAVRDRIAAYLEDRTWRRAVSQYLTLLAGQARIDGFDMASASSPLVQ